MKITKLQTDDFKFCLDGDLMRLDFLDGRATVFIPLVIWNEIVKVGSIEVPINSDA